MWGSDGISFNADTQGKWGDWWGDWVRAFGDRPWGTSAGFVVPGNDDKTLSLAGLPDVVTERTSPSDIPPFLARKWNEEKGLRQIILSAGSPDGWNTSASTASAATPQSM